MKKAIIFGMLLTLVFFSCKKEEDKGVQPVISDLTISGDNLTATVEFNIGVYKLTDKTGALDETVIKVQLNGGTATLESYKVNHTAGDDYATITLKYNGLANGSEQLVVRPESGSSIFNELGFAMSETETKSVTLNEIGIVGEWYSSGANVAVLLSYYFGVDSIYAKFNDDNTYLVESFADGAKTTYTGTFTQTKSGTGAIWDIVLNQSSPTALTSEGIFEITGTVNPLTMKYEVVQTEPSIGATPPTAEAGFGSSSGGAYGTTNVQSYIQIED